MARVAANKSRTYSAYNHDTTYRAISKILVFYHMPCRGGMSGAWQRRSRDVGSRHALEHSARSRFTREKCRRNTQNRLQFFWLYAILSKALIFGLFAEGYRSGHNGADSKSVCLKGHAGSNPVPSAKHEYELGGSFQYRKCLGFVFFILR